MNSLTIFLHMEHASKTVPGETFHDPSALIIILHFFTIQTSGMMCFLTLKCVCAGATVLCIGNRAFLSRCSYDLYRTMYGWSPVMDEELQVWCFSRLTILIHLRIQPLCIWRVRAA